MSIAAAATAAKQSLMNRQLPLGEHVPYTWHSSPHNIRTASGDVLTVLKIAGVAHETADDSDLVAWHSGLAGMLKNIANSRVALWSHLVRRPCEDFPDGTFEDNFAGRLNAKYRDYMGKSQLLANEHYLTLLIRKPTGLSSWLVGGGKKTRAQIEENYRESNAMLDELAEMVTASMSRYRPRRLATFEEDGGLFSEPAEFLGFLINGEWQRVPVFKGPLRYSMCTTRHIFGPETIVSRTADDTSYGKILGITEYTTERTTPGHLNILLSQPYPLVLSQSFACTDKTTALKHMDKQYKKLLASEDVGESQIADIKMAMDDVQSNRMVPGEHDLSLSVFAGDQSTLAKRVSMAKAALSGEGFLVAVEDDTNEAAFFSRLPGVFRLRPRPAMITSRNLIGFSGFHNYPTGRRDGNQWGPAVTLFKTVSGAPFFFNLHKTHMGRRALDDSNEDQRVSGNTVCIGMTGSGKTVAQTFTIAQAEKYKPTVFTFDKDRGQEIFIRAMGGQYFPLKNGQPTGWNPCAQEDTAANRAMLADLVKHCIRRNDPGFLFSTERDREVKDSIAGLFEEIDFEHRNFSTLLQFFDRSDPDGNYQRFEDYTRRANGTLAWLFDNEVDRLSLRGTRHFGFDVTDFLENDETRTGSMMYLLHRMDQRINGHDPVIMSMDEFWRLVLDPVLGAKALEAAKTYRKRRALGFFATQSPRDLINAPVGMQIYEQCVTKMFMPAPNGDREDYVDGLKLTEREWQVIKKEMPEENIRGFLYKQDVDSAICNMDLRGFENELVVLSGTTANVDFAERAILQAGEDPNIWLPVFHQLRNAA